MLLLSGTLGEHKPKQDDYEGKRYSTQVDKRKK